MITNLAIIPARGGSKRITRKNIKNFNGKPIIAYSIETAFAAEIFTHVMVSTDDIEIATIAKNFGADVPFFRSEKNSNDEAGLAEVIEEVLSEYGKQGVDFAYCCCILPTAPFITTQLIANSYKEILENDYDAVIPIVKYASPIQRALIMNGDFVNMLWPENYHKHSQDFPATFHDAGLFYWLRTIVFLSKKKLYNEHSHGYLINEMFCHDIDTQEDWELAEKKYSLIHLKQDHS